MARIILYYCKNCDKVTKEYEIGHSCPTCGSQLIIHKIED